MIPLSLLVISISIEERIRYLRENNPRAKETALTINDEFNLIDPFRELYPDTRKYT